LRHAEQQLQHGHPLVVYPEGRLSVDGALGPILPGAVMLALRAKAPIIPVGISGSNHLMPYGLTCPRPTLAPVRVHVGRPMDLTDLVKLPRRTQREAATQRLEQEIRRAITIARNS
jgi:1-acyl-sn-glycerol-3-phosphate acyltransferase